MVYLLSYKMQLHIDLWNFGVHLKKKPPKTQNIYFDIFPILLFMGTQPCWWLILMYAVGNFTAHGGDLKLIICEFIQISWSTLFQMMACRKPLPNQCCVVSWILWNITCKNFILKKSFLISHFVQASMRKDMFCIFRPHVALVPIFAVQKASFATLSILPVRIKQRWASSVWTNLYLRWRKMYLKWSVIRNHTAKMGKLAVSLVRASMDVAQMQT